MTKKDFELIARVLKDFGNCEAWLYDEMANALQEKNKLFNKEKFLKACKDTKWYCLNCDKKKEEYEASLCDSCWDKEQNENELQKDYNKSGKKIIIK